MEEKKVVFAGASALSKGTPWGTLGLLTRRALSHLGYDVAIEEQSFGENNVRFVGDGRADLGATLYRLVRDGYRGGGTYEVEEPRRELRLIATIHQQAWIGIAIKREAGIKDLREISERRLPVRIKTSPDPAVGLVLEHYGLNRKLIESWGGRFLSAGDREDHQVTPWVAAGDFDVLVDIIYPAYTPEHGHWWEATVLYDLDFLPLPEELVEQICQAGHAEGPAFIPNHLMRGIRQDIATVQRGPQVFYTRADMDEAFVYTVAAALDEKRQLFRETHMPFWYEQRLVAQRREVPLHAGAERYYVERGYPLA